MAPMTKPLRTVPVPDGNALRSYDLTELRIYSLDPCVVMLVFGGMDMWQVNEWTPEGRLLFSDQGSHFKPWDGNYSGSHAPAVDGPPNPTEALVALLLAGTDMDLTELRLRALAG